MIAYDDGEFQIMPYVHVFTERGSVPDDNTVPVDGYSLYRIQPNGERQFQDNFKSIEAAIARVQEVKAAEGKS